MSPRPSERLGVTTLEDISTLILQSHDLDETLGNIVALVAKRMRTEVCSIYLLEEDGTTLRLRATKGLSRRAMGKVTLKIGEGLTGLAAEERRVVAIQEPQSHPRYRYFKETGEERFHSFLGIPLFDRKARDIPREGPEEIAIRGTVAYPGVTSGPVHLLNQGLGFADILDEVEVSKEEEFQKLESALEKTRIQTLFLEKRVAERLSRDDAAIFHTHLMILEDRGFLEKLEREIDSGHSAPYALKKVVGEYAEAFEKMDDPYLRERAADMKDIGRRLLGQMVGQGSHPLQLKFPGILVAREVLPSDMAALDHEKILGIVTEAGEKNSHAVIMAKSLGIPALVGVRGASRIVAPEDSIKSRAAGQHRPA
ncbi:MAG: phosphoenolpyruvate-utilizing N-terminal domain-containing protein [Desulfuromonadales bacterium]